MTVEIDALGDQELQILQLDLKGDEINTITFTERFPYERNVNNSRYGQKKLSNISNLLHKHYFQKSIECCVLNFL